MKNQISILKLSVLAGGVAAFAVGCASSGMSENEYHHHSMDNASMQAGTVTPLEQTEASSTVSALSFSPVTHPLLSEKWPTDYTVRTIDVYTFRVPESTMAVNNTPNNETFTENLPPGSTFVEAAGGSGEAQTVKVIEHSPNPR